jgi:hypothetical protein
MGVSPPRRDHHVVNPDQWPTNPDAAAALVALVVTEIETLDDEGRDMLLSDFLRTAWPSPRSQSQ